MQKLQIMDVSPDTHYRRQIAEADFSLEANTSATPLQGRFYLIQDGEVRFDTRDFNEALEAYHGMCRTFWRRRLDSSVRDRRMASAWGLIGLDPNDKPAGEVIKADGEPTDQKRLESLRRRHWALARRNSRKKKAKGDD